METGEKRECIEALRNGLAGKMFTALPIFHHTTPLRKVSLNALSLMVSP
jgi:hypothetical protein